MPKALMKAGLVGLIGAVFLPRTWFVEAYPTWLDVFPILVLAATGSMAVVLVGAEAQSPIQAFGFGALGGIVAVVLTSVVFLSLDGYFLHLAKPLITSPLIAGLSGLLWQSSSLTRKESRELLVAITPSRTLQVGLIAGVSIVLLMSCPLVLTEAAGQGNRAFVDTLHTPGSILYLSVFSSLAQSPLGGLFWVFGLPLFIMITCGAVAAFATEAEVKGWMHALGRGFLAGVTALVPLWGAYFLLLIIVLPRMPSDITGEIPAMTLLFLGTWLVIISIISPFIAGVGGIMWKAAAWQQKKQELD